MNVQSIENLAARLKHCTDEERLELLAAIQEKETYLKVLNNFAVSLIQITNYNDLVWFVAKEVVARLGFVDCVIYRLDPTDHTLVQQAAMGEKNPVGREILNPLRIPAGAGVTGRVAAQGLPITVKDLSKFQGHVDDIKPALSEICVPLIYGGEVLGVIDCENPNADHFTHEHLEILSSVAAMTSSKIKECEFVQKLDDQNRVLRGKQKELEKALSDNKAKASATAEQAEPAETTAHLLVAEDNAVNQMIACKLIEKFGWTAETVNNGQEAVDAIRNGNEFDVILMDIRMPILDGVSATRAIRALPAPICHVPIIAFTANASPDQAGEYLSAGMNALVSKPIDSDKLKRAITGLISSSKGTAALR